MNPSFEHSIPDSSASLELGFIPVEETTIFENMRSPLSRIATIPSAASSYFLMVRPRIKFTPISFSSLAKGRAISWSNTGNTCPLLCIRVTSIPLCLRFSAVSRPMKPPPTIATLAELTLSAAIISSMSDIVHKWRILRLSSPSVFGVKALAPVAITRLS